MTHEEKGNKRVINCLEPFDDCDFSNGVEVAKAEIECSKRIASALASAKKNGREETKRLNMSDAVRFKNEGWNEAIKACHKIVLTAEKGKWMRIQDTLQPNGTFKPISLLEIAESINQLKRG